MPLGRDQALGSGSSWSTVETCLSLVVREEYGWPVKEALCAELGGTAPRKSGFLCFKCKLMQTCLQSRTEKMILLSNLAPLKP